MKNLRAFNGDPALKAKLIAGLTEDYKADRIVHGFYARYNNDSEFDGGCAVGCTLNRLGWAEKSDHMAYEKLLGIPVELALAQNSLFERMSNKKSGKWPINFIKAIAVNADLSMVFAHMNIALLGDEDLGIMSHVTAEERRTALQLMDIYNAFIADGESIASHQRRELDDISRANYNHYFHEGSLIYHAAEAILSYLGDSVYTVQMPISIATEVAVRRFKEKANATRPINESAITQPFADMVADRLLELLRTAPVPETA